MPDYKNAGFRRCKMTFSFILMVALLITVPAGFLFAQQVNVNGNNTGNSSKVNIHASFVHAGEVSVASKVYVEKIPNSSSNEVFVRIHGKAKNNDSLVVTCGIKSSGSRLLPCDSKKNRYNEARFVTNDQVLFQRLSFDKSPKGRKEIAIEFFYL